jgi:RNA polymerase sigma factor (sigma-70 family)
MSDEDLLADRFEAERPRLRAVAYRLLGSLAEADDAVQETWLRVSRADSDEVRNLGAWFTTAVARVSLNMLASRRTRREDVLDEPAAPAGEPDPEEQAVLADSVGLALLVVLDTLTPAERLAFVLHDVFAVPFEEIGPIVGRSPTAARQLASRGRRRVQGASPSSAADRERQRRVVAAFLAASRGGDFDALLALLDPDAVLRADISIVQAGAPAEVRGAREVAQTFFGRAQAVVPVLVGGVPAAVWRQAGAVRVIFAFTTAGDRITGIEMIADPDRLAALDVAPGSARS